MGKINFGSDEEFISNYNILRSSRKMGELYKCGKAAVLRHAKNIGFNPNILQQKITPTQEIEIVNLYDKYYSKEEIAKMYGVSVGFIGKIWKKHTEELAGKTRPIVKRNIINQSFNELTVIAPTDERDFSGSILWLCKCSCGNTIKATSTELENGIIKSCGHLRDQTWKDNFKEHHTVDMSKIGKRYGKLTVLRLGEPYYSPSGEKTTRFLCHCDCGRDTLVFTSNLRENGGTQSCGLCKCSHGENKIESLLKENNILFIREYKFNTCRETNSLPFDFYVNNQYLIEYDGIQHTKPSFGLKSFTDTVRHDAIKNQFCVDNNIPLIRIPHTVNIEDLKIEDLLLETSKYLVCDFHGPLVKIKKLNEKAIVPKNQSNGAAGKDIYALLDTDTVTILPQETRIINTGIAIETPRGYFTLLASRSSLGIKRNLIVAQGIGVIDSDYRGEILVALHNTGTTPQTIENGERIAQIIVQPYLPCSLFEVNELDTTVRGAGGIGSTGRK